MTDNGTQLAAVDVDPADVGELPTLVHVTQAFTRRLPTQRVVDTLAKLDASPFGELLNRQTSRVLAFRVLLRDHPRRDPASLWLHAYDVDVEVDEQPVDPTSLPGPTPGPVSLPTGI